MNQTFLKRLGFYEILLAIIGLSLIFLLLITLISPFSVSNDTKLVKIGVIDSGCNSSQSQNVEIYKTFTLEEFGYVSDEMSTEGSNSHGVSVCQLIIDNSNSAGIYSAKILDSKGTVTFGGILAAIEWLAGEIGVDIINLSLGSEPFLDPRLNEIFDKYQNEVIFVAASGNDGELSSGYGDWPSILPNVVGVGSVDTDTPTERSSYSHYGLNYYGLYTNEFVEIGDLSTTSGTSFSAPRVTAILGNVIALLIGEDIEYKLSDVLISALGADHDLNFSGEIGWGIPNDDFIVTSKSLVFEGFNRDDPLVRFQNETWTLLYKFLHYGYDKAQLETLSLDFTGNGSDAVKSAELLYYEWGGILELELNNQKQNATGLYAITLENPINNSFTYYFRNGGESKGSILFDLRNSVNGLSHTGGQLSEVEGVLREQGYTTNYAYYSLPQELTNYDTVILVNYGQKEIVAEFEVLRQDIASRSAEYLDYLSTGGNLEIYLNLPSKLDKESIKGLLNTLGANNTDFTIGTLTSIYSICCSEVVSNFAQVAGFYDIDRIQFIGSEVRALGDSQEIAWFRQIVSTPLGTNIFYRSIGIMGEYMGGTYLVIGGSSVLTNEFISTSETLSVAYLILYNQL